MKTMTNRAIFASATRKLEAAGFEKTSSYVSKFGRGDVYIGTLNGVKTEVKLNFKLAKEIVQGAK